MNTTEISLPTDYVPVRKGAKFVSFYSRTEAPNDFLAVEHTSENAARRGSWQSSAMRKIWIYRGYRAI